MKFKFGVTQALASSGIFALVVLALVSVDERVRDRFSTLVAGGDMVTSWTGQAAMLGDAVMSAARHQSIEHAPLVFFATIGAVLFIFMVRT